MTYGNEQAEAARLNRFIQGEAAMTPASPPAIPQLHHRPYASERSGIECICNGMRTGETWLDHAARFGLVLVNAEMLAAVLPSVYGHIPNEGDPDFAMVRAEDIIRALQVDR